MNEKIKSLKENQKLLEFVKFCIVGGISTGIDACIFFTVKQFACIFFTVKQFIINMIALVSGYAISFIANYFMTVLWTFKSKPNKKNAIGVLAAHLINLFVVRFGLMHLFVEICKIDSNIAYIPTLLISIVASFILVRLAVKKL
ncbi:MAG: GtrA family protein [Bacteroidaceae bacterium]|nr:GtrA family protein [Bacteroidaceae bacterium]